MKKISVRLLSMLLCVLLCVTMLPLTALAAPAREVVEDAASKNEAAETATIVSNGAPKIKTQPKSQSVKQGAKVTFKVAASGSGLKYQWYYRTSSSGSWKKVSGGTKATLKITVGRYNGYQYRCKVSNKSGSVTSKAAKLKVDQIEYRALLIGECTFDTETESDGFASRMAADVYLMEYALSQVKGPKGVKYSVKKKFDLSNDEIHSAIKSAFGKANANDVSLFFISTHGVSDLDVPTQYMGALATYYNTILRLDTLAGWLSDVPGKVIVMIGSCGSGAAIYENGVLTSNAAASDRAFTQAVIRAFAAKDKIISNSEAANLGDFCTNKFYVLTAAAHGENSIGFEDPNNDVNESWNVFAGGIYDGMLKWDGSKYADADANKDGTVTLNELYNYVCDFCNYVGDIVDYYQHTQVYPANSSYALFK